MDASARIMAEDRNKIVAIELWLLQHLDRSGNNHRGVRPAGEDWLENPAARNAAFSSNHSHLGALTPQGKGSDLLTCSVVCFVMLEASL